MKITKKFVKRWQEFSYNEQMANIGSEAFRAIKRRKNGEEKSAKNFFEFTVQLFNLTAKDPKNKKCFKEILNIRKIFCDSYVNINKHKTAEYFWQKYFYSFNYAARLHT